MRKAVRQVQQPGNAIATVIDVGTQESLLHFANRVQHRQPVKPCRRIGRTTLYQHHITCCIRTDEVNNLGKSCLVLGVLHLACRHWSHARCDHPFGAKLATNLMR